MVTMRTAIRYKQRVQIYISDQYTTCDPERKILYGNYLRHQDDDDEMVEAMETAEFFNDDDGDDDEDDDDDQHDLDLDDMDEVVLDAISFESTCS